jgi:hypothetical protein
MNRRSFLALFGAAAAGLLVGDYDPSRLTWLAPAADAAGTPIVTMPAAGTLLIDPATAIVRPMPRPLFSLRTQTELLAHELWRRLGTPPDLYRISNVERLGDTARVRQPMRFIPDFDFDRDEITCDLKTVTMDQAAFCAAAITPQSLWRETRDARSDREREAWLFDAYVQPMAAQLAHYIRKGKVNAFADRLPLPCGADEAVCVTDDCSGITIRGARYFNRYHGQHETRFDFLGGRA